MELLKNIDKDKIVRVLTELDSIKDEENKKDLVAILNKEERIVLLKTMEVVEELDISVKFIIEGLTGLEIRTKFDLTKYLLQNCEPKKILEARAAQEIKTIFERLK